MAPKAFSFYGLAPKDKSFGIKQTIYQGSGCISKIPEILEAEDWTRVLLVADPGVLKVGGIVPFEKLLKDAGVEYKIFSKIEPNPLEKDIMEVGLPMYREMKADVMIAIGGGSTMDSAKGIVMVGESDMTVTEANEKALGSNPYFPLPWKTYPLIAVPTTCGTGSEVIRNAVITQENGHKLVPAHDCILPSYAICDPDLLATLPPHVAAATAMDALVQAVEAYVSLGAIDFSDTMALRAIELIGPNIVKYYHNRAIPEVADAMSKGCMYGGFAWNLSAPAQIHGSNHPITELLHISHGDACAILFPPFIEFNGVVCKEKFWKVFNLMYPNERVALCDFDSSMLVKKAIQLNRDLNIMNGKSMADYGCTEETVEEMLEPFKSGKKMTKGYPRSTSYEQIKKMYMDVMNGKYL